MIINLLQPRSSKRRCSANYTFRSQEAKLLCRRDKNNKIKTDNICQKTCRRNRSGGSSIKLMRQKRANWAKRTTYYNLIINFARKPEKRKTRLNVSEIFLQNTFLICQRRSCEKTFIGCRTFSLLSLISVISLYIPILQT